MSTPMSDPVAVDDWSDRPGGWVQEYHCFPPRRGEPFRVVKDEWLERDGKQIRRILAWEPFTGVSRFRVRLHRLLHPRLWLVIIAVTLLTTAGSCQSNGGGGGNPNPAPQPTTTCTSPAPNPNPQPQPGCS